MACTTWPTSTPPATSWREYYPVHPVADVFPMLSNTDLVRLACDIATYGLRERIVLRVSRSKPRVLVLDGRNRLAALERLGVSFAPTRAPALFHLRGALCWLPRVDKPDPVQVNVLPDGTRIRSPFGLFRIETATPYNFILSANLDRRHLGKDEQRDLVIQAIRASFE